MLRRFAVQEMERKAPAVDAPETCVSTSSDISSPIKPKRRRNFSRHRHIDTAKLAFRLDAEHKPLDVMIEVKLSE